MKIRNKDGSLNKRTKQKIIKAALTVICLIILFVLYKYVYPMINPPETYDIPEGSAEFHFIDVGQGDSTMIIVEEEVSSTNENGETVTTKEKRIVLIDTGEGRGVDLVEYLKNCQVSEIDYFVITHFDSDHYGEADEILNNFTVKNLVIPDQDKDQFEKKTGSNTEFAQFMALAETQKEQMNVIVVGDDDDIADKITVDKTVELESNIMVGELELKFLAPVLDEYSGSNDFSIVLTARWGNKKVLFTGDAEKDAEEALLEHYAGNSSVLNCDVFKAGHHGSMTSSCQELVDKASPNYVIISCGSDKEDGNSYNHPHTETMDRFNAIDDIGIYRTDTQGTIIMTTDGENITFNTKK